ncbi:MAG: hypothetical protein WBC05_08680 [Sedimentisphaerales bacterium]
MKLYRVVVSGQPHAIARSASPKVYRTFLVLHNTLEGANRLVENHYSPRGDDNPLYHATEEVGPFTFPMILSESRDT